MTLCLVQLEAKIAATVSMYVGIDGHEADSCIQECYAQDCSYRQYVCGY